MKKFLWILLISLILCGCSNNNENKESNVDVKLQEILSQNNYIILDVRTNEEYKEGHLVDSINIPHTEIDDKIELDKTKTILVYCRSGARSSIAQGLLEEMGYDVYNLGAFDSITLPKE